MNEISLAFQDRNALRALAAQAITGTDSDDDHQDDKPPRREPATDPTQGSGNVSRRGMFGGDDLEHQLRHHLGI